MARKKSVFGFSAKKSAWNHICETQNSKGYWHSNHKIREEKKGRTYNI